MTKNWSYTITEGEHKGKTLWSGRYCAVSAFVFCKFPDGWKVLANKRGKGTPDFQGMWNCPCGYLEANEDSQEGCAREVYEETGVKIEPCSFQQCYVETNPLLCNHGNVTIRHYAILYYGYDNISISKEAVLNGEGEKDEVESIAWVSIHDINNLQWAFNHSRIILEIFNRYISNELWKPIKDLDIRYKMPLDKYVNLVGKMAILPSEFDSYYATSDKVSNISTYEPIDLVQLTRLGVTHVCSIK